MKRMLFIAAVFAAGILVGQKTFEAPSTVLHIVTVRWTKDSTAQQRQAALDGVKTMAQGYPGIKRVWTNSFKVQPTDYNAAFVIEFADRQALEDYVQAPAHVEWKKVYDPIHEQSTTHDVSN